MKNKVGFRSPSFLKGVARTLAIFGHLDEHSFLSRTDTTALRQDWEIVGRDLKDAIDKYAKKSHS